SRAQIDSLAGGSLHTKTVEEAQDLIELVANNQYLYSSEKGTVKKGVMEAESIDTLLQIHKSDPVICVAFKAILVKHVQQFWSNNHPSKLTTWAILQDSPTLIFIPKHIILVGGITQILDGEDKAINSSRAINFNKEINSSSEVNSIKVQGSPTIISSNLTLPLCNQILQSNLLIWN
ncbi:hypothetical protein PIB30_089249, partial [Stylosanthes scabra]|nr:hypothetical protein [Stylosanthes scabra]